jgi:hypothetical protein
MTEAQKRQAQIDRINQKLGTTPEFAKKVKDYFSNPVIAINIDTKVEKNKNDGSKDSQKDGVTQ